MAQSPVWTVPPPGSPKLSKTDPEPDADACSCGAVMGAAAASMRYCYWALERMDDAAGKAHMRRALRLQAGRYKWHGGDAEHARKLRVAAAKFADGLR